MNWKFSLLAVLAGAVMIVALASESRAADGYGGEPQMAAKGMGSMKAMSLYDRVGGTDAIAAVVDRFIDVLASDSRVTSNAVVAEHLGRHTPAGIKFQVTAFVIMATGGPMVYSGRDMKTAHHGLMITEDEWNAGAEDFVQVLNEFSVPQDLQDELLALIGTTHDDIVGQ